MKMCCSVFSFDDFLAKLAASHFFLNFFQVNFSPEAE